MHAMPFWCRVWPRRRRLWGRGRYTILHGEEVIGLHGMTRWILKQQMSASYRTLGMGHVPYIGVVLWSELLELRNVVFPT